MGKSSGSLLLAYWLVCVFPLGCVHLEFFGQWAISSGVLSKRLVFLFASIQGHRHVPFILLVNFLPHQLHDPKFICLHALL